MEQNAQKSFDSFDSFIAVLEDPAQLVGDIADIESAKAEAASLNQHHLLDGYIQTEQAQILKLRGLEQRRARFAGDLGWGSLTFRQILAVAPPYQQSVLQPLFEYLEQQLMWLQDARGAAEQIIKVRLHELDVALAGQTGSSYDNSGSVTDSAPAPLHSVMRETYV